MLNALNGKYSIIIILCDSYDLRENMYNSYIQYCVSVELEIKKSREMKNNTIFVSPNFVYINKKIPIKFDRNVIEFTH